MGSAIVINIPWLISQFLKLMMPFVDPVTRAKVNLNPVDLVKEGLFTKTNLMTGSWDGNRNFEYSHEKYWPALVRMCGERRAAQRTRWKELGGTIGLDEWDIKTGHAATLLQADEKIVAPTEVSMLEPEKTPIDL
jgi:hypothetical protein